LDAQPHHDLRQRAPRRSRPRQHDATIDAIEKALIKVGVEFTNGDEPGVKLRAKKRR